MLTDDEIVGGFEDGSLDDFPHASHVRVALVYLTRCGRDEALGPPASLLDACSELLDRNALGRFYTPERLHSEEARTTWVAPDLAEIARI